MVLSFVSANAFSQIQELWGMTSRGGQHDSGVVFKTDTAGDFYEIVHHFANHRPEGGLTVGSDGTLYGMTLTGGQFRGGTIFGIDPKSQKLSILFEFENDSTGVYPRGNLIEVNGLFYCLAQGGKAGGGTVFSFDPQTNSVKRLADLLKSPHAHAPIGSFAEGPNGNLFATTKWGGNSIFAGLGTIIEYDLALDTLFVRAKFEGDSTGEQPDGNLLLHANGLFYGLATHGGHNGQGVLYSFNPKTQTIMAVHHFNKSSTGEFPDGSLMIAKNGKLYGGTAGGGDSSAGVFFEFNPATSTYKKLFSFPGKTGASSAVGELIQSSNGKLYGLTKRGGKYGFGTLYEYDIATEKFAVKHEFSRTNGGFPVRPRLVEITNCRSRTQYKTESCDAFTSPSGKYTWNESGVYFDTVSNVNGCDSFLSVDVSIVAVDTTVTMVDSATLMAQDSMATYQWLDCNDTYSPLNGETKRLLTNVRSNGSYAVQITKGSCIDTSSCYSIVPTNIDRIKELEVSVFPNPAQNVVYVGSNRSKSSLTIYSTSGQVVLQTTISNENIVDISALSSGFYLLHVNSNAQIWRKTFVIK